MTSEQRNDKSKGWANSTKYPRQEAQLVQKAWDATHRGQCVYVWERERAMVKAEVGRRESREQAECHWEVAVPGNTGRILGFSPQWDRHPFHEGWTKEWLALALKASSWRPWAESTMCKGGPRAKPGRPVRLRLRSGRKLKVPGPGTWQRGGEKLDPSYSWKVKTTGLANKLDFRYKIIVMDAFSILEMGCHLLELERLRNNSFLCLP